jgi:transcriptional regulator with XRE-family HTH domain
VTPSPSQVFAERTREVRDRRRWSQQDLADRLSELGAPLDRAGIARLENGNRGISLDDAITLTVALGAQFMHMIIPLNRNAEMALAPALTVRSSEARQWFRGMAWFREEDRRTYFTEVPDDELLAMRERSVALIFDLFRQWHDATANGDEDIAAQRLEELSQELARQQKAIDHQRDDDEQRELKRKARHGQR